MIWSLQPNRDRMGEAMTAKQRVLELVSKMPEGSTMEEILYHLYVQEKVQQGRDDIAAGRVVTHEDARKRLARWLDG